VNNKIIIGLENPKSPNNVGSVMRAAGNFSVDSVVYTGKRYPRALMRNPDLPDMHRKVSQNISLLEISDIIEDAPRDMAIVCVEFAENALSLIEFQHPDSAYYIFGPEDGTLNQKIINKADAVIYIPTIDCMNLSATVNVVLYDRMAKLALYSHSKAYNNKLIRQSRDINNNLKVKY
jgi:tRNA(Leu) C34 or U34 (ribose-2'-O)-methylase TrmL